MLMPRVCECVGWPVLSLLLIPHGPGFMGWIEVVPLPPGLPSSIWLPETLQERWCHPLSQKGTAFRPLPRVEPDSLLWSINRPSQWVICHCQINLAPFKRRMICTSCTMFISSWPGSTQVPAAAISSHSSQPVDALARQTLSSMTDMVTLHARAAVVVCPLAAV